MPPGTTKRRTRSAVARRAQRATAAADPASTAPGVGEERFCPDPLAGLLVGGRYRIEAAIGDGGYGAVYRARHTETGGLVAVKFLRAEVRPDKSAVRRFCLEAQNAAALSHPNTIRVTDFGVDGNLLFYAMEYLEGHSLAELMSGPERLSWRRSLRIVAQALSALCAAHEHPRRIVHRDIKPGNIMVLHPPGHEDFVKVIDFGIARALQGTLTSTRGVAGTPRYMAPEQWEGTATDARTDLYALGCVLYEILAGVPPFVPSGGGANYVDDLRWMHRNVVPAPLLGKVDDDVPGGVLLLTQRLMAKRPALRPRSAREALELLGRAERGEVLEESCTMDALEPVPLGGAREPSTIDPPRPACTASTDRGSEEAPGLRRRSRALYLVSGLLLGAASLVFGLAGEEPAPVVSADARAPEAPSPAQELVKTPAASAKRVTVGPGEDGSVPEVQPAALLDLSRTPPARGLERVEADELRRADPSKAKPKRKQRVRPSKPTADRDLPPRRLGGRALGF